MIKKIKKELVKKKLEMKMLKAQISNSNGERDSERARRDKKRNTSNRR